MLVRVVAWSSSRTHAHACMCVYIVLAYTCISLGGNGVPAGEENDEPVKTWRDPNVALVWRAVLIGRITVWRVGGEGKSGTSSTVDRR